MLSSRRARGLLALLLLAAAPAMADPLGRSFTYQGKLSQAGTPVTGTVSLRFSLWNAAGSGDPPVGGVAIGVPHVLTDVPVTDGIFSVELNAGDQFGPQAFNGDARWLQVEVCTDGTCSSTTVLGPRQPMTGAPYALGPWQLNGVNLSYSGGGVGIGTATPQASLDVYGTMRWGGGATEFTYSGIDGVGLYLEQKGSSLARSRMRFQSSRSGDQINYAQFNIDPQSGFSFVGLGTGSGNVGIGTAAPAGKLDVRGDIRLGSSGQYRAAGGSENLRLVRGTISSSGSILAGAGFTASRVLGGVYHIIYTTPFTAAPTVTASARIPSGGVMRWTNVLNNSTAGFNIYVHTGTSTFTDSDFDFCVMGAQ